jgi:hypothetical protein
MRYAIALMLSACASLAGCQSSGGAGAGVRAHASVSGSHGDETQGQVATFRVTSIDGWPVGRSEDPSKTYGVDATYPVDAGRTVRVEFEGLLRFGNPFKSLAWDPQRVEGRVEFMPAADVHYVVRGTIDAQGSSVWLEDDRSHEVIGVRFDEQPKPGPVLRENSM